MLIFGILLSLKFGKMITFHYTGDGLDVISFGTPTNYCPISIRDSQRIPASVRLNQSGSSPPITKPNTRQTSGITAACAPEPNCFAMLSPTKLSPTTKC